MRAIALVLSALAFVGMACAPLRAQTLSAEDILAKVDEKVSAVGAYQVLLNDPDPTRSMAAMEVMLGSGDPGLVRLALDFGLYSPNTVVQRMALEGFFASGPLLNIFFSGEAAQKESNFPTTIQKSLRGSVDANGVGFTTILVGKLDPEKRCYVFASNSDYCFVSLSDNGVTVQLLEQKGALTLNDQGELVGFITLYRVDNPVSLRIPVTN